MLILCCREWSAQVICQRHPTHQNSSLERPCLYHTQIMRPSSQALSMQSTLLQHGPSTFTTDTRWEVSAEAFQRLFEMADKLDLNGYITPVQAWNRIRDHENFSRLTREKLRALEHNMRPNIRCQGWVNNSLQELLLICDSYAAIMEEAIFEILLDQALSSWRKFIDVSDAMNCLFSRAWRKKQQQISEQG